MKLRTPDDVIAWLDSMPDVDAVRLARLLADGATAKAMAAHADRMVWQMTREATYEDVAKVLDEPVRKVKRAVERERDRLAGRAR